jgi:hypothetical protein
MDLITLSDDDLSPIYFVLEFTTQAQLIVLGNYLRRTEQQTRFKSFCLTIGFDTPV